MRVREGKVLKKEGGIDEESPVLLASGEGASFY